MRSNTTKSQDFANAAAAIVEAMLKLNRNGVPEYVVAAGALIAAVDVIAGDERQDVVPTPLLDQLVAWRLKHRNPSLRGGRPWKT